MVELLIVVSIFFFLCMVAARFGIVLSFVANHLARWLVKLERDE